MLVACRPVGETILEDGVAAEDLVRLTLQHLAFLVVQELGAQRVDDADDAVRRCEASAHVAVELLRPEAVVFAALEEALGALVPGVCPPLLAGAAVELGGGEHRAGGAPHDLDRLAVRVLPDAGEQAIGPLGGRLDEPGDSENPRLSGEQRGLRGRRELDVAHRGPAGAATLRGCA